VAGAADQLAGHAHRLVADEVHPQQLEQNPNTHLPQLEVEELTVEKTLTRRRQGHVRANLDFSFIGSQGKPAFANSWVNYGSPYSNAGYIKRPDGWVELVGVIKSGRSGRRRSRCRRGSAPRRLKSC
jgi:hypothetical protein